MGPFLCVALFCIVFSNVVPAKRISFTNKKDVIKVPRSEGSLVERADIPSGYIQSPPYYPTPKGGWISSWQASYAKAASVVGSMTLAEKVNLTTGTGWLMGPCVGNTGSALRFGIPNLCLQDSALGISTTDNITAFPAGITVGATFNKDLMYSRGEAIGKEARGKGINIQLGPTVGPLGRKPRGGRNWEGFGADPVLQAVGGAQYILGMQSTGVIATIKHWIGNEQEKYRMDSVPHGTQRALSANIDDRTLHELYMWPFAEGIRAGVGAVMSSYNEVNGSACSQNSLLLNGLLKDELGFQGFVMTDWFSHISGVGSGLAGQDMSMPGDGWIPFVGASYWASDLSRAVLNGSFPVDRLNDMVTRIVATWYQLGQDKNYPLPNFSANTKDATGPCYPAAVFSPTCVTNQYVNVQADHATIAKDVAREGITLLKNNGSTLPLSKTASLYVFGTDAQAQSDPNACGNRACNTGTLGMGWGSGVADYPYLDDPITAIRKINPSVKFTNSDSFPSGLSITSSDIAIVFITSDSGENSFTVEGNHGDRDSSGLAAWHSGDKLVQNAAAAFSTVIVVVHTVGPIIVEPWISLPSVKGVIFAHLPGQEAGSTLTDVLFGSVSPSGHLPYSIPVQESDYPSSLDLVGGLIEFGQVQDTFAEGLYIDYRYLNKQKIKPRYPFGHGLSYTSFSITSATLTAVGTLTSVPPARSAKPSLTAQSTYTNTIPAASEAAWPSNLTDHIRAYLYPYLDDPASIKNTSTYPYPTGYSTTPKPDPPAGGGEGGNPALWDVMYKISVTVTNAGKTYSGKMVPQLYVQHPSSSTYDTPIIQLRDFTKTSTLAPGASQTVEFSLTRKDLSVWDIKLQNWVIPGAGGSSTPAFVFWIGESSGSLTFACEASGGKCSGGRTSPVVT